MQTWRRHCFSKSRSETACRGKMTAPSAGSTSIPDALRSDSTIPAKAKNSSIRVSPDVLDASRKDGEELLQSLRTTAKGLSQADADERARTAGPNELARERPQGWAVRLLKIIRNPLVIL